jgi:uncharacterized protein (DUF1501 family)
MFRPKITTRREFLRYGSGVVGVGSALPNFLIRSALAGPPAKSQDRIVVGLLLTGGHDGLSDVPPYGHEDYYRLRTSTRIEEKEVLKLNDEVGLHPSLKGFRDMLDEQAFAVVLGTGYPNYNLSHFVSRDIWEAGRPGMRTGKKEAMGWLGRYIDHAFKDNRDAKLGLAIGPGRLPLMVTGQQHPGVAFESRDSFRFVGEQSKKGEMVYKKLNKPSAADAVAELQFVTQTAVDANQASQQILNVLQDVDSSVLGHKTKVPYPDTQFGDSLRTIAALIGKNLGTRVYYAAQGIAKFGGYDTHAEQKPRHAALMTELCQAVRAFYHDLKEQGNADRVLTFSFSEFGRRVKENYSSGTDHGLAQPMFLFGPMVKPGVHGKQPSLTDLDTNGNLKMEIDFRRVYADVLDKWLKVPHKIILGEEYSPLDCIQS